MRRSDIVFGIILVLFISDFALAAPLLTREKRHACVDVVHIPKDMMTVLGKRGDEDLDKLAKLMKTYFETEEKPVESSDAHASSSPAPPGPDQGSTVDVKAPEPNPGLPPANPYPVLESSRPPGTGWTMPGVHEDDLNGESDYEWPDESDDELSDSRTPSKSGSDHELTGEHAPQPKPNPGLPTGADPAFDWEYWANEVSPPRKKPALPKGVVESMQQPNLVPSTDPDFDSRYWENLLIQPPLKKPKLASLNELGQAHDGQEVDLQHLNPGPPTDSDFDWKYWTNLVNPPPLKKPELASSKELGQAHDDQDVGSQHLNPGPPTESVLDQTDPEMFKLDNLLQRLRDALAEPNPNPGPFRPGMLPTDPGPPAEQGLATEPEPPDDPQLEPLEEPYPEVVPGPPPSPESTDPELHSDHHPVDLLAAIAKLKGKSEESPRIPDTGGGSGNAA